MVSTRRSTSLGALSDRRVRLVDNVASDVSITFVLNGFVDLARRVSIAVGNISQKQGEDRSKRRDEHAANLRRDRDS